MRNIWWKHTSHTHICWKQTCFSKFSSKKFGTNTKFATKKITYLICNFNSQKILLFPFLPFKKHRHFPHLIWLSSKFSTPSPSCPPLILAEGTQFNRENIIFFPIFPQISICKRSENFPTNKHLNFNLQKPCIKFSLVWEVRTSLVVVQSPGY